MSPLARRQSGVALVLVIWLATLMMVVASSYMLSSRTDALIVQNSLAMARAEAIADAGIHRGAHELYRHDITSTDIWKKDGTPHEWLFDDAVVTVEMRDESARIDINTASDALLRGLLMSVGLEEEEATALLDAILDWRDSDRLKRLHGAEESEYVAAGVTWRPANAPFQAVEELQLVLGMRPDIYRRLIPLVTVHSRSMGVSILAASREVLLAIPGVTPEIVDAYIATRDAAIAAGSPPPAFVQAQAYQAPPNTTVATVRSQARLSDGTVFAREAVVLLRGLPRRPLSVLAWRSVNATEPKPVETAETH